MDGPVASPHLMAVDTHGAVPVLHQVAQHPGILAGVAGAPLGVVPADHLRASKVVSGLIGGTGMQIHSLLSRGRCRFDRRPLAEVAGTDFVRL